MKDAAMIVNSFSARRVTAAIGSLMVLVLLMASCVSAAEIVPHSHWHKASSPERLGWSEEKLDAARTFGGTLGTAALMIVQDGIVVDEWGATALPLKCHSVRKSLLSALYGPHVEEGTIDLDRTMRQLGINDLEPSLTESELSARIRDLLAARSGVYHPALYETNEMAAKRPERGSHAPGTFWYYNNWDFNASCTIFEHLTGRSVFEEFEDHIAKPLGMEDFVRVRHTRYVFGDDSTHPAYPFELSTRDLARFGLLFLREGRWGDEQIIPKAWVRESTMSYSDAEDSGGYGFMWWVTVDGKLFPGVTLPAGSYAARGHRGQFLVVIPKWKLVICHRVNSFQEGTEVSKGDFGKLLSLILEARPESPVDLTEPAGFPAAPDYDVILRGGEIVDGTGRERFRADVAIADGRIARIGDLKHDTAESVIDVNGQLIAPGFIDLHSHADVGLVSEDPARRSAPNLITQGITTVVINQDGGGPPDLLQQRATMNRLGVGMNVVPVLGHGTIRGQVMGDDYRRPATGEEVERMQNLLRSALQNGAFGMSAGLEYVPGRWSTPREMEALASTIAEFDGVYIVHERSSGSRPMWFLPSRDSADQPSMIDNLHELIDIAGSTDVRTVCTHIKARGTDFWGSSRRMNELLKAARDEGIPIFADQYPYNTSGSDGRIVLIPAWAQNTADASDSDDDAQPDFAEGLKEVLQDEERAADLRRDIAYEITRRGGPESILIVEHPAEEVIGRKLADYAKSLGVEPVEAAIQLQLRGDRRRRGGARLRAFSMSEEDVEAFAKTPWTATSSDAGIALPDDGPVHPRFYGAFPRKIRQYAIDRELFSIEEAVRVSTSLPAQILQLTDRGVIRAGACADLVVFDPEKIRDTADAFNPHQYSAGISYVFVNGEQATAGSRWLGKLAGRVLRRPERRADRLSPEAIAEVEHVVRELMSESKAPGVSVAVAVDNDLVYSQGFGLADLENEVPVTTRTRFRTASIAKSMTAVVVLSLKDDGKLDLDAEVQQYCSEYPQKEWPLTCRHLLCHLGGVRHYRSPAETRSTQHFFNLESALSTFADDPLKHEPGTKFLYTTFGYNLLGSVAEGASGERFAVLLKQRVFEPAGMTSTVIDDQAAIISHRTRGYMRVAPIQLLLIPYGHHLKLDQIYNAPLHDTSMKIPGGGLLSTPTDLVRFALALNAGKLLKDETREAMWTVQKTTDGEETGYGLGWKIQEQSGQKMVSHTGGQAGTSTVLVLLPEAGTSVAIMCNLQRVQLRDVAAKIAEIVESR